MFMRNLRKLLLLEQHEDGSWGDTNTSLVSTSLSGSVETSAYVVIALGRSLQLEQSGDLAKATYECTSAIAKGLQFIIAQQQGRSGWRSTRDTLYAAWAVAETVRLVSVLVYLFQPLHIHIRGVLC